MVLPAALWLHESEVPHILLDWKTPEFSGSPDDKSRRGHCERFLYRVAQFKKLFPRWFRVADPHKPEECQALTELRPVMNVASARKDEFESKTTSREYQLEQYLVKSESFRERFDLKFVDRQFPVGEPYGDCLTHPRGHYEMWDRWRGAGPSWLKSNGLPIAICRPPSMRNTPVGASSMNPAELFVIYADRRLQIEKTVRLIVEAFRLAGKRFEVRSDGHYR